MPKPRHPNPQRVKLHRSYNIDEAARVTGKHPQTIRTWINEDGLPIIDKRRPHLIRGRDLRAFLVARRVLKRRPCPRGTLYCFRCREPRRPAFNAAEYRPRAQGGGNVTALCSECGAVMCRCTSEARLGEIFPGIDVRIIAGG